MNQSKDFIYLMILTCLGFVELRDERPDGLLEELQNYDFKPGDLSTYATLYNQDRILILISWKVFFVYFRPIECSGECYYCIQDDTNSRNVIIGTDLDYRFPCLYKRYRGSNKWSDGAYIAHLKYKGRFS